MRLPLLLLVLAAGCVSQTEKSEMPPLNLDEANVVGVEFDRSGDGTYTFRVSVIHNDTGWEHYANWWRIKTVDGEEIARRVLAHPHVNEQPFTRALSGIEVPEGVTQVVVEAHCSVHGYGGQEMLVDLNTGEVTVYLKKGNL